MNSAAPLRSWVEMLMGGLSALVFAATLVWPDWIERLFGIEPDGGDGSAEWGLGDRVCGGCIAALCRCGSDLVARRARSPRRSSADLACATPRA